MRLLLLCVLASAVAAEEESRLGTLIRWYLQEEGPARREDFLEAIERLTAGDPQKVADAIRRGLHFDHADRPVLRTGGKHPHFSLELHRIQPIADCAGDFAALHLPARYDPARAYPLLLELGHSDIPRPDDAIVVQIQTSRHAQARSKAWAGEALVMSLLAHLVDVVHVDPRRVFLRAETPPRRSRSDPPPPKWAELAWYIALHNPDRFAGVLAARGVWPAGAKLAPNAKWFVGLAVERYEGDRPTLTFMRALREYNKDHIHRRARATEKENHEILMPTIRRWWKETVREQPRNRIALVCDRGTALRAFWIRMAPRAPSSRRTELGHWFHRVTARPATLTATVLNNLVEVKTSRVAAFDIYAAPGMFDFEKELRVSVNGQVPESKLIYPEIADLLEDYRERRDTDLLYPCKLTFSVRGR